MPNILETDTSMRVRADLAASGYSNDILKDDPDWYVRLKATEVMEDVKMDNSGIKYAVIKFADEEFFLIKKDNIITFNGIVTGCVDTFLYKIKRLLHPKLSAKIRGHLNSMLAGNVSGYTYKSEEDMTEDELLEVLDKFNSMIRS
jgi:hypothetical protein